MSNESNEQEDIVKCAVFGRQVEEFYNTNIGRYLLARADLSRDAAVNKLKVVDAEDATAIRHLQNEILWAEGIKGWLGEAVSSGVQAMNILEDGEQ